MIPPKELLGKLRFDAEQSQSVMEAVNYRVQWAKHQEAQRKKEEEEKEKERVAYSQIDWHGFVVVETVDFQPGEQGNFPPPLRPEDIGRRILAEKRYEQFGVRVFFRLFRVIRGFRYLLGIFSKFVLT